MTRKMILIAGVAGMALTAPASAQRGERGKDSAQAAAQQGGGQRAERPKRQERAQVQRAERPQRQERAQVQRAERPQRVERQVQRAERPQRVERPVQRAERPQRVERQVQRVERQQQRVERPQRIERQQQRAERQVQRVERPQRIERQQQRVERQAQRFERRDAPSPRRIERFGQRSSDRNIQVDRRATRQFAPLLASREMRQMKPFKAKFDDRRFVSIGDRIDRNRNWSPVPAVYGSRYADTPNHYYRYDNDLGYAYQINRQSNIVSSLYPLFGGYSIGDPWPQTYYSSYVPSGYRSYYYDTPDYYYRNDGYGIYQVDSSTQLITALVSLVMGQGHGIGQALPSSYGAYNVPLDYRANYYDTDDSWYRYGDGFIYQMDPGSRLISARYPLYSDNYYVGQPWPVAYPDYNVPYAYRSAYADTPQYHYRYANNGIYQVDPTNQLIMALVALVSGDQFAVGQRMPTGYDMYNVPLDYRDRYADSDEAYYRYANGHVYRVDADSWLIEEAYPIYT